MITASVIKELRVSCLIILGHYPLQGYRVNKFTFVVKGEPVTQLTFTCSKSTTETLEEGVKYVQKQGERRLFASRECVNL